jgi:hypothetical protein
MPRSGPAAYGKRHEFVHYIKTKKFAQDPAGGELNASFTAKLARIGPRQGLLLDSHHNANVFYELGIRHALRKKRSVLIKGSPVADDPPFDLLTDRYHRYNVDDPASLADHQPQT